MHVRVSATDLKLALSAFMKASKKIIVSFAIQGRTMLLQTNEIMIDEIAIAFQGSAEDDEEITVAIEQAVQLLNDEQAVEIESQNDMLILKQLNFEYTALRVPTNRIETKELRAMQQKDVFNMSAFKSVVVKSRFLDGAARNLGMPLANLNITDNACYIYYSNIALKVNVNLPTCGISSDIARNFASTLERANCGYYEINKKSSCLNIVIKENEFASVPVKNVDYQAINQMEAVLSKMVSITKIDLTSCVSFMEIFCKAYSKTLIDLSICEDGIRIYVDNARTRFNVGSTKTAMVTIKISVEQLTAIYKLFGTESRVEVKKGVNCICLINSKVTLSLAGMLS